LRGALLLPPDFEDGWRVPLILHIYPGLDLSSEIHRWDAVASGVLHLQLLASRGYAVLMPGLPSAAEAVIPDWTGFAGGLLTGVNEAIRLGIADETRVGVMGHSGGGTAVNRLITETTRFGAAVSSAGAADVASFFGQLRVDAGGAGEAFGLHNMEGQCGGPPWARPQAYVAASPIYARDRVETPLLLIHGTEDDAVGVEQAGEMFVGLRLLGKSATLLRYHGEGHNPVEFGEANRRDVVARVLAWFDEHLRHQA
jgi:dipeptidyl aminopeptidase/acylaminoacyl peptidase